MSEKLNMNALNTYLNENNFIIKKYFILDRTYFLLEVLSIVTAEFFLLYIPDKYNMKVLRTNDMYSIKYIELKQSTDKVSEYIGNDDDMVENVYKNIDNELEGETENIECKLEKRYNKDINITDISHRDMTELKSLNRQLSRLKNCVENLDYKITVFYKDFFGIIRRSGNCIDFFKIRDYSKIEKKQFYIVISLDTFLSKLKKNIDIINEMNIVKHSIYKVLEKNELNHVNFIDKILESKKDLLQIPKNLENRQKLYNDMIERLERLLSVLNDREQIVLQELQNLKMDEIMIRDIKGVEEKNSLDSDLSKINEFKTNIIKYIYMLRQKKENTILNIDQLVFDNTVMWNRIVNNCTQLKEYY